MKLNKTILGVTTVLLGSFVLTGEVSANEWKQRTVDEVQESIKQEDGNDTYTIQYGDTLGVISKATGIEMTHIAKLNGIEDVDVISTGNQLTFKKDEATGKVEEVVVEDTATQEEVVYEVEEDVVVEEPTYVEPTYEEPVTEEQTYEEPTYEEPVTAEQTYEEPVQYTATGSEAEAKEWIAQHESGGDYNAYNSAGGYYGRYQLNPTLVAYGASPAEQEVAVQKYVNERYNGSFVQAKAHWQNKGWY